MPLLLCLLLIGGCTSLPARRDAILAAEESLYVPQDIDWQPVARGIETFSFRSDALPLRWHAVKIDLASPGLELVAYPGEDAEDAGQSERTLLEDFARRTGCTVAVNTTPFAVAGTARTRIAGVHTVRGTAWSEPASRYAALVFRTVGDGLEASVVQSQVPAALAGWEWAFGGFFAVLSGGEPVPVSVASANSRSGAGVSADGRTLFLLVVEGERSSSAGLSYQQCARVFAALGCSAALEFDGGGSANLYVGQRSVLSYAVRRTVAACMGFRAEPLP